VEVTRSINEFLRGDLLGASRPEQSRGRDLTVRSVLDRAAASIGDRFTNQPLVEAGIRTSIGGAYRSLGEYNQAQDHLKQALTLRQQHLGEDAPDTLRSINQLAAVHWAQGRYEQAKQMWRQVLSARKQQLGQDDRATLAAQTNLALSLRAQGKLSDAEPRLKQASDCL